MQAPALLPHNGEGVAQEPESDAIERPLRAPRAVPRHSEPSRQGRSSIADALTFRQPSHTRQLAKACQPRTGPPRLDTRFVCLAKRGLPPFRNIDLSLTPPRVQFTLPTLVVSGFSLISRCTYRAHAAF